MGRSRKGSSEAGGRGVWKQHVSVSLRAGPGVKLDANLEELSSLYWPLMPQGQRTAVLSSYTFTTNYCYVKYSQPRGGLSSFAGSGGGDVEKEPDERSPGFFLFWLTQSVSPGGWGVGWGGGEGSSWAVETPRYPKPPGGGGEGSLFHATSGPASVGNSAGSKIGSWGVSSFAGGMGCLSSPHPTPHETGLRSRAWREGGSIPTQAPGSRFTG